MQVRLRGRELTHGITYYLDYYLHGKRYRERLKIPNHLPKSDRKKIAEKRRTEKQIEFDRQGGFIQIEITVSKLFADFEMQYQKKDIRKISAAIKSFSKVFDINRPVSSVNENTCKSFRDYLSNKYTPDTTNSYFKTIGKIFNYAVGEKYIYDSPFKNVKGVRVPNNIPKDVLTPSEIMKLLETDCSNNEVKRAFIFATQTGFGNTDCRILEYEMIKDDTFVGIRGKGRSKPIPINALAKSMLDPNRTTGKVFNLPSTTAVSKALRKWVKLAKINKHITFYSARHSLATNLIEMGIDIDTVREIMDHSSYKYLQRYLHRADSKKRDALDLL